MNKSQIFIINPFGKKFTPEFINEEFGNIPHIKFGYSGIQDVYKNYDHLKKTNKASRFIRKNGIFCPNLTRDRGFNLNHYIQNLAYKDMFLYHLKDPNCNLYIFEDDVIHKFPEDKGLLVSLINNALCSYDFVWIGMSGSINKKTKIPNDVKYNELVLSEPADMKLKGSNSWSGSQSIVVSSRYSFTFLKDLCSAIDKSPWTPIDKLIQSVLIGCKIKWAFLPYTNQDREDSHYNKRGQNHIGHFWSRPVTI